MIDFGIKHGVVPLPHPKAMLALMKVACSFRNATGFLGYISMYTGVYLNVSL